MTAAGECRDCQLGACTRIHPPTVTAMDAETYHADPIPEGSLSHSGARKLLPPSCPAIFDYERRNPPKPTAAFSFGHAAHAEVLGVGRPMVVIPDELLASNGATSTKAAREFIAQAEADGNTPLKAEDAAVVKAMAEQIRQHPIAGKLFEPGTGRAEQAMFWRDQRTGITRRCMLDWLRNPTGGRLIVPDYKTALSADPEKFRKSLSDYGYHQQAAWYLDAIEGCGLADDAAFVFVVQDKNPPYVVSVFEPDPTALRIGDLLNRRAIDIYRECTETGRWPGYSDDVETVRLPWYVENQYAEEALTA